MRKSYLRSFAIVVAATLALSGTVSAEPLAPGKPAGVQSAQMGSKEWLVFGGLAAVAVVILIGTAGSGHDAVVTPPITVTSP